MIERHARRAPRGPRASLTLVLLLFLASPLLAQTARLGPGLAAQLAVLAPADRIEVVVTFDADTVGAAQIVAVRALGITRGLTFQSLPIMGLLATGDQVRALATLHGVRSIWPNSRLTWHNFDSTSLTGARRLRADAAMTARNGGLPYSGRGVTVVVHDSGVDATHADLAFGSHVIQNVQGATNLHALSDLLPITYLENQPTTDETSGHGTHVAGMVGGNGAQSGGRYEGAAPGADLVGYGSGAVLLILDAIGGFDYAITHQFQYRIRVINNSWGSSNPTFDPDDPVNVASKRAFDRNIVVVFSAGNAGPGENTLNPYAKAPWVIGVAAGDKDGHLVDFSSRGVRGDSSTVVVDGQAWTVENRPTITGPGRFVVSTRATTNVVTAVAGDAGPQEDLDRIEPAFLPFYTVLSGTSMAAPHVSGIVALMLEANTRLSPLDVKSILQQTATNIPGREPWEVGAGYANAYAAVDRAFAPRDYGRTVNMTRVFNSTVQLSVAQTPFTIEYNTVPDLSPTRNQYAVTVPAGLAQLACNVEVPGSTDQEEGNAINLVLIAPDGSEHSSGVPVLFTLTPGRSVVVDAPMPGGWTVELRGLRGTTDNPTSGVALPETVGGRIKFIGSPAYTGLDDVAGHPAEAAIRTAVGERLVDGLPGGVFRPDDPLLRIQQADYLTEGAATRQFLPPGGGSTLTDLAAGDVPFAEAVAARGAALRDRYQQFRGVMLPTAPGTFSPLAAVRRADLAYALVQSLGLEAQALSLNGRQVTVEVQGQRIPIDDQSGIPAGYEGYVQIALDLKILNAFFSLVQGPFDLVPTLHARFEPLQNATRGEYAVAATRFFNQHEAMTE